MSETSGETELHVEQQRSKLQGFMKMLNVCVWIWLGGTWNNVQCPRNKCVEMGVWLYPNVIKDYTYFLKVKLLSTVLLLSGKWCLAGGAPSMAEGLDLRGVYSARDCLWRPSLNGLKRC